MRVVHFTYKDSIDRNNLQQGDILKKTDDLVRLMENVHPHYAQPSYTHFQVITQSCDLVKRKGKCSAKYITLAAVKPLSEVITSQINELSQNDIFDLDGTKYCSSANKRILKDFLSKIFNNNHKELFFLRADPDNEILIDSCTLLHLSIAIKSQLHYQLCLDAKIVELDDNFKSKLGWAVGNLYSRVGTVDFADGTSMTDEQFDDHIDSRLSDYVAWINEDRFSMLKKALGQYASIEDMIDYVEDQIKQKKERSIQQIANQISKAVALDDTGKTKVMNILSSNSLVKKALT